MRVLIAEDDTTLREGLVQAITRAGHDAISVADGSHADTLLATESFDLLVLDLGLPELDGLDVLNRLRGRNSDLNRALPVLILSARSSTAARVRGLDRGADDYLTKPFDLPEFEARVRALLRRGLGRLTRIGRLHWDADSRQGRLDGRELALSLHETALVDCLLRRVGRTVSKATLAEVIGNEGVATDNKVEVYIHRLRRKLLAAEVEIRNVRGLGYMIHAIEENTA